MDVMSDATITAMACGQLHPHADLRCNRIRGHTGEHIASSGDGNALSWPDLSGVEDVNGGDPIPTEDLRDDPHAGMPDPDTADDGHTERLITGPPPALERVYKDAAALMAVLIILLLLTGPALVIAAYRAALG